MSSLQPWVANALIRSISVYGFFICIYQTPEYLWYLMQGLAKQSITTMNFQDYLFDQLYSTSAISGAYENKEEAADDFMSGFVTVPFKDVVAAHNIWQQLNPAQEPALVSFGNYLFNKYAIPVYSNDGTNTPLYERQVTDADIQNWKIGWEVEKKKLPSRFQNGDKVKLCFSNAGELTNAEVIKVHFSESKVLYDVELAIAIIETDELYHTRLYNVDSVFVEPA